MNRRLLYIVSAATLVACLALLIKSTVAGGVRSSSYNVLLNGDFENGAALPANWSPDSWMPEATFVWDNAQSHQGSRSIQISLTTLNDARWIQTVTVQPDTEYRLSGWIKTENVAHSSDPGDAGANLSIYGTWDHTPGLFGTNAWTNVSLTFNTGTNSQISIAARLGYWSGTTTGTVWFDDLKLEPVNPSPIYTVFLPLVNRPACNSTNPGWKILALVYGTTDFQYTDAGGQARHFTASLTQAEKSKVANALTRFANVDVPALNSCAMQPTITIRYVAHPLTQLSALGCNDYAPDPIDVAADRDAAYDSVIAIWDGSGTDQLTGQNLSIQGCAYAWNMGTGQAYNSIYADFVSDNDRNVFKHEWGHSILFYYEAAGTAPLPAVDNHINATTNRYVNCTTGQAYILQDETDSNPIPNSIYHNESGFTHDYYSGLTATPGQPARCLGITPNAWALGGPVTRPSSKAGTAQAVWRGPADDVIGEAVPYR